ncbi:response regulator [Vibrio sp. JC009]|uniref:response regulator n=1 Tax=Vibrio sp. JC009 TaxID=2912314 RepID=UPI0023AFD071|nr:response regulator [Vibrio sp. JC009]WED20962.1 response regulator [Vibrio sp. JC009]
MTSSNSEALVIEQKASVAKQSILLVDDDPIFRNFITALLKQSGYSVSEAEHGLDALRKLKGNVPDLILCDLSMPILDGIEFAEEVCWEYPDIPMIVVSATEDMSDVARALKFGIKDFLSKPISVPQNLISAISNVLEEEAKGACANKDFSSQWFRVGEKGDIPDDKELHWHLDHLQDNPSAARELLLALLPDRDTKQGNWTCSYNLLQSSESMPLVFDYAWLVQGQFAFYIIDSSSNDECGVAASLLVRALFNDSLRNQTMRVDKLKEFVVNVEKGIECLGANGSVSGMVGIIDMTDGTAKILPAGLDAIWTEGKNSVRIHAGNRLGEGVADKVEVTDFRVYQGGKLNLANIGVSHFSLDIRPLLN